MAGMVCAEQLAYEEIRQRILDGRLGPGTRLVHRAVAADLGMSPNPVVLALRMLERDGLVVNTPGLGACVRRWSRDEIIDSYHIRAAHEAVSARLCALRRSMADMEAIDEAHEAVRRSVDALDAAANVAAELVLHAAIVRGAHCPELERLFQNIAIVQRCMTAFAVTLGVPRLLSPEVRDNHAPIVEAVRSGDAREAERAARDHVEDSLARNLAWIERVSTAIDGVAPHHSRPMAARRPRDGGGRGNRTAG